MNKGKIRRFVARVLIVSILLCSNGVYALANSNNVFNVPDGDAKKNIERKD